VAKLQLSVRADANGWDFSLQRQGIWPFRKAQWVTLPEWPEAARTHPGVALLLARVDGDEASVVGDAVVLPHRRVALLSRPEAARLALPAIAPFTLFLSREAPLSDPDFRLRVEWFARGGGAVGAIQRLGTRLTVGGQPYLLLDPLFSLLESIEPLNALRGDTSAEGLDRRMTAYAVFQTHLEQATGDVRADDYLKGLAIHHATGLGLDLELDENRPIMPTLYGTRPVDVATEANETVEAQHDPLLPPHYAQRFGERFAHQGSRRHYTLGSGVYAVLDAPVAAALTVVEQVNREGKAARAAFRKDPMAFLIPAIEAAGGGGGILCDLRGYGERVIGIGPWEQAKLSFRLPVERTWFPEDELEVFTIPMRPEAPLVVHRQEVAALHTALVQAEQAEQRHCNFNGRTLPLSPELASTVKALRRYVNAEFEPEPLPTAAVPAKPIKVAAITQNNEENLIFLAAERNRGGQLQRGLPPGLASTPMPHQQVGIEWLQTAYQTGAPGVLLADDMGLGKTFQVLALLRWLHHAGVNQTPRPFLVVAPKTLLGNWLEEVKLHLGSEDAFGAPLKAFEADLRKLKVVTGGNDTTLGRQTLDVARIEQAGWVLTTYETLRDYHLSFGKVRFSLVVYDEAQKLKNPASLMTIGAKAQQGDFTLMMTGTPIENSVLDLWTLLDIAWPGFLGFSAKDFIQQYAGGDKTSRDALRSRLVTPIERPHDRTLLPPVMLRRFKVDNLKGLPPRQVAVIEESMPAVQQAAYDAVVQRIQIGDLSALAGLQMLRVASLHPDLVNPPQNLAEDAGFIAASARFTVLFRILDHIHAQQEKALIFIELRDAQTALYGLIQRRYDLAAPLPETINGETAAPARDRIRRNFQARHGFDVLILGPKAAGFGLTLTAANHVIHLNRWWNPAVEDQCSDRVYRIGQNKPVTIHLPLAVHPKLAERSFDHLLHELLEEKRDLSREIVVPVQFDERDFRRLIERSVNAARTQDEGFLEHIDNLDWRAFEHWAAGELRKVGFEVRMTPQGADGGADIVAQQSAAPRCRILIQCKHRSQGMGASVDEAAVRELLAAQCNYGEAILVAVTNGQFTLAAQRTAAEKRVQLIGREGLQCLGERLVDNATIH
jgi:hypothetical protein